MLLQEEPMAERLWKSVRSKCKWHVQAGLTWTEICAQLGGGDLERGKKVLEEGILRNDILDKGDGFYYFKRVIADDSVTRLYIPKPIMIGGVLLAESQISTSWT